MIPRHCEKNSVKFEAELGVMLKKGGRDIKQEEWRDYVGGYFLALDYTDFNELVSSRSSSLPWLLAKSQDNFLFLSDFIEEQSVQDPHNIEIELKVNDETKQKDLTGNMHFKIGEQIAYCS